MKCFIQGVFFQDSSSIDATLQTMFAGLVGGLEEGVELLEGEMMDVYGFATISDFSMTDTVCTFRKQYHGRDDSIEYNLSKESDGVWMGIYNGSATGSGPCRCVITQVSDEFFSATSR